jgi:hypothetical protein
MNRNNSLMYNLGNGLQNIATNAINNAKNTGANMVNSFFPVNKGASAATSAVTAPVMNAVNAVKGGWDIPWGLIIVIGFLITIIVLVAVFYDQISRRISDLTGKSGTVSTESADAKGEEQDPLLKQKAASVVNAIIPGHKEVFHIMDNKYAYEDAEPLCKAYGAELATDEQVKDAWKKGADWCSYGWVKGQAAVYPTSEDTWTKLQQGPDDQKTACGLPGVNGGYFDNDGLRFGVNCYGEKPAQSAADAAAISRGDAVPKTRGVLEYERKIATFRGKKGEIPVAPFNDNTWSQ